MSFRSSLTFDRTGSARGEIVNHSHGSYRFDLVLSNCVRHRVGCIIADTDQRIVATGYNGVPDNIKACNQGGCTRCCDMSIERICIHAEESSLFEAGHCLCRNATLYVTHNPCRQCSKKIIQNGIKRVV
ncbi:unnamed protein product [Rotaria sp. Silwood2]|nr:unnamed protein product [Rotaria sp. Silwood2]